MTHLGNDWDELLKDEINSDYMNTLRIFLNEEYDKYAIYPPKKDILNALALTAYSDVKVVILGQDPYHEPNQAHGLAFSVKDGNPPPPSLKNIFKEISDETGSKIPESGNLTRLAEQGVLMLNAVLTVRRGQAASHKGKGWERFTDSIISTLNNRNRPIIFLLWGNDAKKKAPLITNNRHFVLTCAHPSPLSAYNGFFGCGHFNKANEILTSLEETPIKW